MGRAPNHPNAVRIAERYKLHPVGERIALLAAEQWGVLGLGDLVTLGLPRPAVGRWCDAGHLHRLHRGVYAVAPESALTPQGRELAAVWACGDAAVLFSVSAAVRWGMLRFSPPEIQVLIRSEGRRPPKGVALHITGDLPPTDITTRDGIPITTVERTILDLAADPAVSDRALESAAAQAERDGWLRRPAQLRVAARARRRTGAPRLRTILSIGPTLPLNAARDVVRDAALARAGWRTLRVGAAAVRERPDEVVGLVRAALGA